jgi:hypothetical protein
MNMGIKKFKAKGKAEVNKELTQMHNMSVLPPNRGGSPDLQ